MLFLNKIRCNSSYGRNGLEPVLTWKKIFNAQHTLFHLSFRACLHLILYFWRQIVYFSRVGWGAQIFFQLWSSATNLIFGVRHAWSCLVRNWLNMPEVRNIKMCREINAPNFIAIRWKESLCSQVSVLQSNQSRLTKMNLRSSSKASEDSGFISRTFGYSPISQSR